MALRPFKPNRSLSSDVRFAAIEDALSDLSVQVGRQQTSTERFITEQATADASGTGGSGGVVTTLPESQVIFDPVDGHKHDGGDGGTPIPLLGDATGTNTAVVVNKAKGVDFPTPASTDDWKLLSYFHSGVDYVLRHPPFKNVTKTANYPITLDDYVILADAAGGNVTLTLPTAASATQRGFIIKRKDSSANTLILDGDGAETIDGSANYSLAALESITVLSDGSAWYIV